jgi:hypothetical protein
MRLHEAALHELDEFLLVDGRVAASPHALLRPTFVPMLSIELDKISTWCTAITRITLHPAFRLQVDLNVEEDLRGHTTIHCAVRHADPDLAATVSNSASARENSCHVQQLLALVRHSVQRLLDECLILDGTTAGATWSRR